MVFVVKFGWCKWFGDYCFCGYVGCGVGDLVGE